MHDRIFILINVIVWLFIISWDYDIMEEKKKIKTTEDEYNKALASDNPTKITTDDLEKLTKESMKKFK